MRRKIYNQTRIRLFNPFHNSYLRIKSDEERKKKTIKFGILAIVFSFICIGLCYPCVWLGIKGVIYSFTHNFGILTYLIGIGNLILAALSCGVMLLPYYFWIQGIVLVAMQLRLNRKFISWLALIIWLACLVGIFLLSLESFLSIAGLGHVFQ